MKQPRISIPPKLEAELTEIAAQMGLSYQEAGRMAIRLWIRQEQERKDAKPKE